MRVLLVDDEAPMRLLMRRFLSQDFDLEFLEADDGATALELLLTEPVDAVMLDLRMRVMNGIETLQAIRHSKRFAKLPVVLVTGQAEKTAVERARELGVQTIVVKPFSRESLRERVQEIFERARKAPKADEAATARARPVEILPSHRVLVVDRDAGYRGLLGSMLGRLASVEDATNEFSALTRCLDGPRPDAVVVGEVSEFSSLEACGRKIREIAVRQPIPLIAAAAPDAVETVRASGLFDVVVVRSLRSDLVFGGLVGALSGPTAERLLMHPLSPAAVEFFEWVRTELARMGTVPLRDGPPELPAESRGARADARLAGRHTVYDVRLFVPLPLALRMAATRVGYETDLVSDVDVASALEAVVREGAQRLQRQLAVYRYPLAVQHVRASVVDGLGESLGAAADRQGTQRWLASLSACPAVLTLTPSLT